MSRQRNLYKDPRTLTPISTDHDAFAPQGSVTPAPAMSSCAARAFNHQASTGKVPAYKYDASKRECTLGEIHESILSRYHGVKHSVAASAEDIYFEDVTTTGIEGR